MLCWNVYVSDFNSGEIVTYNVFNHWAFYESCVKAKKKFKDDREAFAKEVRSNLMYYFWSKCEWEIILNHWPDGEKYEMRKDMTVGQLRDAMRGVGVDYPDSHISEDCEVSVRVYLKHNRFKSEKIDVYDQVMANWDIFIDYLWNNRAQLKVRK